MKPWLKKSLIGIGLILSLAALTLGILWWTWRRGFDAEVRSLESSGAPIHSRALAPPALPDAENAALPILAATKVLISLDSEEEPDWEAWLSGEQGDLPGLEQWVQKREEYYKLMTEAMRRPRCRFPVDYDKGFLFENDAWKGLLKGGRASGLRAILNLKKGGKSAAPDIQAMLRLSDSLSGEPLLVSQLIRYVLLELAVDLLKRDLLHLTPEEWTQVGAVLAGQSFEADYSASMDMERAMGIQMCSQLFFKGKFSAASGQRVENWWWMAPFAPKMATQYVRSMNKVVECSRHPYRDIRSTELRLKQESYSERSWDSVLGALLVPAFLRTHQVMVRAQASQAQAVAYCKLRAAGTVPESLDVQDPFTGKPMLFRKTAEGFRLWSVGENQKDDDGEEDDIVLNGGF